MERTLEHVEQPELAGRPPEGGHREVVLEHDDVRRLLGPGFNGTYQFHLVIYGQEMITSKIPKASYMAVKTLFLNQIGIKIIR